MAAYGSNYALNLRRGIESNFHFTRRIIELYLPDSG